MWSPPKTKTYSGRSSKISSRFWKTASAVPRNQNGPLRIWAGTTSTYCPISGTRRQVRVMCSMSEFDLNCVSTLILRNPELMKLLMTKSMIRYRPPNGTAGLARSRVSGYSRSPIPPARIMVRTLRRARDPYMGCRFYARSMEANRLPPTPRYTFHAHGRKGLLRNPRRQENGDRRRDQKGLSQPCKEVPPRQEQGEQRGREQVQGDLRGVCGAQR